ncbi:MAG: ABC transporter ATP-binding protein/permease [Christensenellaceae bacterium]|jgi:ATP-binding cassette subfamily B protein|nr:ABC transporter ATP-binding protein/permease [Christensenellaceae bacterium]
MIKILKYLKWHEWVMVVLVLALTGAGVWLDLTVPEYMTQIIGLFGPGQAPTSAEIWDKSWHMLLIVGGSIACSVISIWFATRVAAGLSRTVRRKLFEKVNGFSMQEMNKFSTPSLIVRTTNDITQLQTVLVMTLRMAVYSPIMVVIAATKIIGKSIELSSVIWIAVAVLIILLGTLAAFILPKFSKIQKLNDKLSSVSRENLTGIRVIRANGAENIQQQKFEGVNSSLTNMNLFVARISAMLMPIVMLIFGTLTVMIYWLGAELIGTGATNYDTVVLFATYGIQIIMSFLIIAMLFIMIPRGQVSANRIREVLNTRNQIIEGALGEEEIRERNSQNLHGQVEFKNVSFKYPDADEYMLKDISFTAHGGQTVAFIGSTGSGKSTLINLIPRFFDATDGEILIDGINVRDYKFEALNNKLGFVPQKGVLFSGSIRENIQYGKQNADDQEINRALEIAQSSFVFEMEGGLDYQIAQSGKNVSGGQRQRLSIARAVVKNPEIYIFDDSFSALDYKTDKALRASLKENCTSATKFIVAQRVGSIMDADQILVLEKGMVVGCGTHKELLKSCEIYKEIAFSQLSKEELKNE